MKPLLKGAYILLADMGEKDVSLKKPNANTFLALRFFSLRFRLSFSESLPDTESESESESEDELEEELEEEDDRWCFLDDLPEDLDFEWW